MNEVARFFRFMRKTTQGSLFDQPAGEPAPIKPRGIQAEPKKGMKFGPRMKGATKPDANRQQELQFGTPPPMEKPEIGERRVIDGREYVFLETTPKMPRWHTPEEVNAIDEERDRKNFEQQKVNSVTEAIKPSGKLPSEMSRTEFEQLAYKTKEDGTRTLDGRNLAIQPGNGGKFNVNWEGKLIKGGVSLREAQEILKDPYTGLGGKDSPGIKGDKVVEQIGKEIKKEEEKDGAVEERGTKNKEQITEGKKDRSERDEKTMELFDEASKESPEIEDEEDSDRIEDFGEKIGGARKDVAAANGPREKREKDDRPAWERKYVAMMDKNDKWTINVITGKYGNNVTVHRVSRETFDTEEEAKSFFPIAEVARNHRVFNLGKTDQPNYAIVRKLGDRKAVPVKDGFKSEEEAQKYMVTNPKEIIEKRFQFPDKPWLDKIERRGAEVREGDVSPRRFQETFGFRGGEFGNWNMGSGGQAVLNHAYDALSDLAATLQLHPKALSLNGQLAIAFGARGHGGTTAARAHYEPDYGVINLTKIRGAGSLAHEWFHALDHFIGRIDTKASSERPKGGKYFKTTGRIQDMNASYGFSRKSQAREELRKAFEDVMNTMTSKEEQKIADPDVVTKQIERAGKNLESTLSDLRNRMTEDMSKYNKRWKKPTEEQLKRWDELSSKIKQLEVGDVLTIPGKGFNSRWSYKAIEELNDVYKEVTGRSFATMDDSSSGRRLYWDIDAVKLAKKRAEQAGQGITEKHRRSSEYLKNSREIDKYRSGDYWSTPHEMAARAFEGYVSDKIKAAGNQSDYLVYGANNNFYNLLEMKPYPEGDERKLIDAKFDELMDVLRQEELATEVKKSEQANIADATEEISGDSNATDETENDTELQRLKFGDENVEKNEREQNRGDER